MKNIPIYRAKKIGGWNKENHRLDDWDRLYCDSTIENLNILLDLGYKVVRDSDQCYSAKDPFKGNSGKYIFIDTGFSKRVDKCWLEGQNLLILNSFGGICEFFNPSDIVNNNEYIFGNLMEENNKYYINPSGYKLQYYYEIDPSTLSIHFPDMLDSQGNKIFASLSEDEKGGSILTDGEYEFALYFDGRKYRIINNEINSEINDCEEWNEFNVIGVQQ